MRVRKTVGILLTGLLALAVTTGACGDDDDEGDEDTSVTTATTISPRETVSPARGVTTTSIAGAITTLQ